MFVSLCQSAVESLNASKIAPVSLQHGQRYFLSAYLLPLALRKNGLGTRLSLCTSIYGYGGVWLGLARTSTVQHRYGC